MQFSREQENILKEMGVIAAYLFGSHAQGVAGPLSDIDVGIVFENPEKYRNNTLEAYNKLYRLFSDVFADTRGEPDVVLLQFTPLALQYRALRDGKVLFESDPHARFQYQEEVLKYNADLKYFSNMRHKAILDRI